MNITKKWKEEECKFVHTVLRQQKNSTYVQIYLIQVDHSHTKNKWKTVLNTPISEHLTNSSKVIIRSLCKSSPENLLSCLVIDLSICLADDCSVDDFRIFTKQHFKFKLFCLQMDC